MMHLTVDGVDVQTYAWNIGNRGGRWNVPKVTSSNLSVPGRHGTLWTRGKTFDENTLTLSMWAVGCNADGTFPSDRSLAQKCRDNLDALVRLFTKRHALLEVVETDDLGVQRRCYAEMTQAIDFSTMANGTRAEFAVELVVPAAFWEDVTPVTFTTPTGITAGTNFAIDALSGGSAPIEDAIVTFSGVGTNPKLIDMTTGDWLLLTGLVADGATLTVDCSNWTAMRSGTNVISMITHSGRRLLALVPHPQTGVVTLRVEGTGFGANTKVSVTARRKWLIG